MLKLSSALLALLHLAAYLVKFLCGRQDTAQTRKAAAEEKAADKDRAKIATEVRAGDADAVNRRLQEFRRTPLPALALAAGLLLAAGCTATRVVYVPEADKAVPMERAGKPGWWVPDHVLIDLIERASKNTRE